MTAARRSPDLPRPALVGLAALAGPRVVLHDLGIVEEGSLVNGLLVVVPPAVWIAVVLWHRPPRPFRTVVVIGAIYGVFLAVGHQLLWRAALPADVDLAVPEFALRAAAVASSLVTGTLVGVVAGAVAVALCRVVPARDGAAGRGA
ncbi:MAG TPA: hypothetical protein VKZ81_31520 [Pseudonocardia sp.]|jgi:hypothetical protein|uniref:hypothetical protein n=1 Tax=Pseudonocardia sp. TaxID=60912 RepID=UPI002B4B67F8|nr:hypothetical protein [Pseudonocardia sp.]HLU60013.1 hypothetical protein [Pseudonocardia sp.]